MSSQVSHTETEPEADTATEQRIAGMLVSRDPSDYSPRRHFLIRAKRECGPPRETRTDPPITGDVIRSCITDGSIERDPSGPDRARFVTDVDGYSWRLIARLTVKGTNEVLSAFVPGKHQPSEFNLGEGR